MGTKYSSSISDEDKLYIEYVERLRDKTCVNINKIGLGGIERLCKELELEMHTLEKKTCKLSEVTRKSIKDRYITTIQWYREKREIPSLETLLTKLTEMKAPRNKSQETTFERQITTARQELKELKSNKLLIPITNRN